MNPFPLIYCPLLVSRPACCPWAAGSGLLDGKGADVKDGGKGGGTCYGGPFRDGAWQKTPGGWYVLIDGHQPQHLGRAQVHPRLVRWQAVPGHAPETWWRIPVMIQPLVKPGGEPDRARVYVSALDRIWGPDGWRAPSELEPIMRDLMAIADGAPLADTAAERDEAIVRLAIALCGLGQWVDADLMATAGWLTDAVMDRIILAACGHDLDESVGV